LDHFSNFDFLYNYLILKPLIAYFFKEKSFIKIFN